MNAETIHSFSSSGIFLPDGSIIKVFHKWPKGNFFLLELMIYTPKQYEKKTKKKRVSQSWCLHLFLAKYWRWFCSYQACFQYNVRIGCRWLDLKWADLVQFRVPWLSNLSLPRQGTADAEMKISLCWEQDLSKVLPFAVWRKSENSQGRFTYCHKFCLFNLIPAFLLSPASFVLNCLQAQGDVTMI